MITAGFRSATQTSSRIQSGGYVTCTEDLSSALWVFVMSDSIALALSLATQLKKQVLFNTPAVLRLQTEAVSC